MRKEPSSAGNNLAGTLSESIGNLTQLVSLGRSFSNAVMYALVNRHIDSSCVMLQISPTTSLLDHYPRDCSHRARYCSYIL